MAADNDVERYGDQFAADLASEGFPEISSTVILNLCIGTVLLLVFELKRDKRSVFAPKIERSGKRGSPPPLPHGFLAWVMPVIRTKGHEVLALAGLDAYLLLRFTKLCMRICLFDSVLGMLVLAPLYSQSKGGAAGFYQLTLANVPKSFWVAVLFAYLFTAHALFLLDREYATFAQLRADFLCYGDLELVSQVRYSVMVEQLPKELRSSVALKTYFDALFPGQVHSAVVCQDLSSLEALAERRAKLIRRLEKARQLRVEAGPAGNTLAARAHEETMWIELRKLNDDIAAGQREARAAAEQVNSGDEELLTAFKRKAIQGLRSLGELLGAGKLRQPTTHIGELRDAEATRALASGTTTARSSFLDPSTDGVEYVVETDDCDQDGDEETASAGGVKLEKGESMLRRLMSGVVSSPRRVAYSAAVAEDGGWKGVAGMLETRRRLSATGFITFNTLTAKAEASQLLITHRPGLIRTTSAPEPRDIVFANVTLPAEQVRFRGSVANLVLAFGALLWSIPITFVQAATSIEQLERFIPFLAKLDRGSIAYSLLSGYLPVLALLGLMNALPYVFQLIAQDYEGRKSKSEVQQRVMSRFFYYQIANIYITVTAGSVFEAFESIIDHPRQIINILGQTFPSVAVYFMNVCAVKALSGLPLELSRVWPLLRVTWSQRVGSGQCCKKRPKRRTQGSYRRGAFANPILSYGWVYPTLLLVLLICFTYSVISPLVMPVGGIFFALAWLVYKYQVLYVYIGEFESGGSFWFDVHEWSLICLTLSQLTLIGYITLRGGIRESLLLTPLPIVVYWYRRFSLDRYKLPSQLLSLERARQLDDRQAQHGPPDHCSFDPLLYTPPVMVQGPQFPEPIEGEEFEDGPINGLTGDEHYHDVNPTNGNSTPSLTPIVNRIVGGQPLPRLSNKILQPSAGMCDDSRQPLLQRQKGSGEDGGNSDSSHGSIS